jgi:hypothetical protein
LHVWVHEPPEHDPLQFAPAAQVIVQPPSGQTHGQFAPAAQEYARPGFEGGGAGEPPFFLSSSSSFFTAGTATPVGVTATVVPGPALTATPPPVTLTAASPPITDTPVGVTVTAALWAGGASVLSLLSLSQAPLTPAKAMASTMVIR